MKTNILLFTQTMHSLLRSSLPLQSALSVCSEILSENSGRTFTGGILKAVNEGKKLADVLAGQKSTFSPLYVSLVAVGEESGTLADVFGHLASYIRGKKNLRQKIIQAMAYPALVLATAVAVIFVLMLLVMPRLEEIFMAFTESSKDIGNQMARMESHFRAGAFLLLALILGMLLLLVLHRSNGKAAFFIDSAVLRIPLLGKACMAMQMYDFSFAMKLLASTHFPIVPSLMQAKEVLSNRRLRKAVESACVSVTDGAGVGESFEAEGVFPKYLTVWIKIAEQNGNSAEAFSQICDYYSAENENILAGITAFAEPVFILVTGAIIIAVISQFVIPVFNLLGAL